jgi:2,4-dienoyl-CoA reductase-like NADH-dependent reductase (Old Yellow Enzyme family)
MMRNDQQDHRPLYRRSTQLPGEVLLNNRVVMLPLTRARAEIDGTPNALMAVPSRRDRYQRGFSLTSSTIERPALKLR